MVEHPTPFQMQVKGFKIFEHEGYEVGADVPVRSVYLLDGRELPADHIKSATHTHGRTRTKMDGVKVRIVFMTREEADKADEELFDL